MPDIHPTAIVDASAQLAAGVRIGPYCLVGPHVTIGEGTELRGHTVVESHTRIGRECVLFQFACIGGTPQDRKFKGEITWCELGDRNHVREHVTIHRGTGNGGGMTRIGHDNLLMAGSHVAHDCHLGDGCTIANEVMLAGHVQIEDGVTIAGGAGFHHFVTVGRGAMISGMARVERDVPPYMVYGGSKEGVRKLNDVFLRRHGAADGTVECLFTCYRRMYGSRTERLGVPREQAMAALRLEHGHVPEVVELLDFELRTMSAPNFRFREQFRPDDKRAVVNRTSGAASIAHS
ncbi:MAG: acyl-ACP--UDP-N-acetylglucosamine O-acyltransferase [Phycisphaerae bacterium]|jgi:UDP-N-acetylglucosamine acyltransferase|nr:acyl-ACP--UDP-N-acetylglucosamine O-acyltransferase [Phycisphaerae bacterium]